MTATAETPVLNTEDGPCDPGCLICATSMTPGTAYRPHTFGPDCWCTIGGDGRRAIIRCYMSGWVK
jgi:hypothetical protein